ncbi:MAG: Rieske (2Fe-2S) protein [Kiritimatiellaeota bacterium]|nr:Rieske (2Fe-2S) protein [Kiritimatiellota bacterium]
MKSDTNQPSVKHCPGCRGHHTAISRRRFLTVGSGCVLGALGAAAAEAAKLPTVDIGKLKDFAEDGISVKFIKDDFFVMRYHGKFFAASTTCPHMGNTLRLDPQDATRILCGTHGSTFDGEGMAQVGPATSGLVRHGISVNGDGKVIVDPNKQFPQDKWTDKGCFVEIN